MRIFASAALAALLVGTVAQPVARAQDSEDAEILRMAKEHYKLGLDAFKAGRYPEAIKELKKAYLLKRLPPLLINIAKTYEKLGDVDNEIYYYKKYLAEAPPEAKDRDQVKARIDELVAQKNGAPPPSEATPPAETPQAAETPPAREPQPPPREQPVETSPQGEPSPPPRRRTPPPAESAPPSSPMPAEWTHTPIDAVPPGQPVDVRVQTPVMKGVKVWLYYRGKGESDYKQLEMRRRGQEKIARIPGGDVNGKSFQYYIEAKDPSGAIVKSSGSQSDPNIVMIDPSAPVQWASASQAPRSQEPPPAEASEPPPVDEAPPAEEQPRPRKPANPDEEAAPLGPRDDSPPLAGSSPRKSSSGGPSGMLLAGVAVAGAGVIIAGLSGVGFYFAGQYAQAVQSDAYPACQANGCKGAYLFNDPKAKDASGNPIDNDKVYQDKGHLADLMGGIAVGVGAAMVVAGGALILVDYLSHQPKRQKAAPRSRREAAPQPGEEPPPPPLSTPPPDETPPAPQSSIQHFIAAPIVSSTTVGLGAGFQF